MELLYHEELKDKGNVYVIFNITEEAEWIEVDWLGYQDQNRIKTGMNHIIPLLEKFRICKILNKNNHHHGAYPDFIYDWIENEWLPGARKSGLKYTATVLSPKVFSRLSALQMESKFSTDNYKNFDDTEEAIKWLKSKKI
jgi:hypothetical protein